MIAPMDVLVALRNEVERDLVYEGVLDAEVAEVLNTDQLVQIWTALQEVADVSYEAGVKDATSVSALAIEAPAFKAEVDDYADQQPADTDFYGAGECDDPDCYCHGGETAKAPDPPLYDTEIREALDLLDQRLEVVEAELGVKFTG